MMLIVNFFLFDRYMFWIDGVGMVGRVNMDGIDFLFLVVYGMMLVLVIVVDYKSKISLKYIVYLININKLNLVL